MCRGLPVERYTRKQVVIAYWGISLYWGVCPLVPPYGLAGAFLHMFDQSFTKDVIHNK